mgnify:FL=1
MTNSLIDKEKAWLLQEKYNGIPSTEYEHDVARLVAGEPVDYVIGFSKFLHCTIDLSERTLIPRTETEYWVSKAIETVTNAPHEGQRLRCLDIFSGSGCIGIAVLTHIKDVTMDFADIDETAVQQIKKNLELNGCDAERFRVFQSDVFASIPEQKYDIIFANPPYIAHNNESRVQASVFEHEPHTALFAPDNGLFFIEQLLIHAPQYLTLDGRMYIEHDDMQKPLIQILLNKYLMEGTFHKDQFGIDRLVEVTHRRDIESSVR